MHALLVGQVLTRNNCTHSQGAAVDDGVLKLQEVIHRAICNCVNTRHHALAERLNLELSLILRLAVYPLALAVEVLDDALGKRDSRAAGSILLPHVVCLLDAHIILRVGVHQLSKALIEFEHHVYANREV